MRSVSSAATHAAGSHDHVDPVDTSSKPIARSVPSTAPIGITPPPIALPSAIRSGSHAPPFDGEQVSRPSEPRLHLVGAEQEVELAAEIDERGPERVGRGDAPAAAEHRLDHEPRHLARIDRVVQEVVADVVDGPVARAAGRAVNGVRYALG